MEWTKEHANQIYQRFSPHVHSQRLEEIFQEAINLHQLDPCAGVALLLDFDLYRMNRAIWLQQRETWPKEKVALIEYIYDKWMDDLYGKSTQPRDVLSGLFFCCALLWFLYACFF